MRRTGKRMLEPAIGRDTTGSSKASPCDAGGAEASAEAIGPVAQSDAACRKSRRDVPMLAVMIRLSVRSPGLVERERLHSAASVKILYVVWFAAQIDDADRTPVLARDQCRFAVGREREAHGALDD